MPYSDTGESTAAAVYRYLPLVADMTSAKPSVTLNRSSIRDSTLANDHTMFILVAFASFLAATTGHGNHLNPFDSGDLRILPSVISSLLADNRSGHTVGYLRRIDRIIKSEDS